MIDVQKQVYEALTADPALSLIPVVKYYKDADSKYPFIVYREISNVPAMHADNVEVAARVTFQISIVTDDDDYSGYESVIKQTMLLLGYMRVDSEDIQDGNDYMRVLRFCKSVES